MPPELSELTEQISLTPFQAIGIPIALVGAVFLSLGAQFQHRGVGKVEAMHGDGTKSGLSLRQVLHLLARPSWVLGSLMLALAVVFQLTALGFAPLIVVQPLGVVALVITAIVNARVSRIQLDRRAIRAIVLCVGGVGVFVTIAAVYAVEQEITQTQLLIVLGVLGLVTAGFGVAFALLRKTATAMFYIVGAGVLYGFVATLAKVVLNRILNGNLDWLTVVAVVALLASAVLGGYFVQTAYSVGSPDLVIAGLTVVDPLVAVLIGVIVLGEASLIPPVAAIAAVVVGVVAIFGVIQLAKHHPQTHR
ncbi:MAG: DMT family transporter [Microcella pacifica]|uniref:Multidrug DMT transporter permease n=1 Tax=Microcella pacifica TaxID=2591847 RepID=A0A9E5JKR2_9MICO|nr:DMT family transporter [Microcella pacifica]MBR22439.1 multidrug DMT transporter permease [Leifsonia sp.]NHF62275.1 multidrug DMT transporter permease [Microcella pacifica]